MLDRVQGAHPRQPRSEEELLLRARALAGRTLAGVASSLGAALPDVSRAKGFVGTLLETALGGAGSCRPAPDFEVLGVEMKVLPVGRDGRVRESTYVTTAHPARLSVETWSSSIVRKKLSRVLFVVVESDAGLDAGARRVGASFLWSPSPDEEAALRRDWEDLADLVARGLSEAVTARRGVVLQLRPKASDAGVRRPVRFADGEEASARPQGFYLRRPFTEGLLRRSVAL